MKNYFKNTKILLIILLSVFSMLLPQKSISVVASKGNNLSKPKFTYYTINKNELTLRWAKVRHSSGYDIYLKQGSKYINVMEVEASARPSATIENLVNGKKYSFKIRAYKNVAGKKSFGPFSKEETFTFKGVGGDCGYHNKWFYLSYDSNDWCIDHIRNSGVLLKSKNADSDWRYAPKASVEIRKGYSYYEAKTFNYDPEKIVDRFIEDQKDLAHEVSGGIKIKRLKDRKIDGKRFLAIETIEGNRPNLKQIHYFAVINHELYYIAYSYLIGESEGYHLIGNPAERKQQIDKVIKAVKFIKKTSK